MIHTSFIFYNRPGISFFFMKEKIIGTLGMYTAYFNVISNNKHIISIVAYATI